MESKKTSLFEHHKAAGAKIVDFAGWQMPIQYPEGIVAEHLWTRKHTGLFDVSHMGRFRFSGTGVVDFLKYVLTSDVAALETSKSQYCIIANEAGGAVDDAYLYRFVADEYILVVNASNKEKDFDHLQGYIKNFAEVAMTDASDELAMIALQGPESEKALIAIAGQEGLPTAGRNSLGTMDICGTKVLVGRTGYTGEPVCFELMISVNNAGDVWNKLLDQGAKPIGLGARDTLRLEAGLPLYGHEFGVDPDGQEMPIFACPLAKFAVSFDENKEQFIGKEALQKQPGSLKRTIKQVALLGKGIARDGAKVLYNGVETGYITSGTMVPYWQIENGQPTEDSGKHAVALAMVDSKLKSGDKIEIDVRGRKIEAVIVIKNMDNRKGKYCLPIIQK